jgi:lipoprotein-anchoring transpeptidase ErfK/SrfK
LWQNRRVAILQKKSGKKRGGRGGDFFAVLLLLIVLVGLAWLWWHQKHSKKFLGHKTVAVAKNPAPELLNQPAFKPAPTNPSPEVVPEKTTGNLHSARDVFEAQVALARRAISPGSIDGAIGSQTRAAIAAFQRAQKLPATGSLETNTRALLALDSPLLTDYVVTTNDLARLQPIGKTWLEKSQQSALDYETILELVAEKAHAHPLLVQKLNPGVDWANVPAGTVLKIPDVNYPEPDGKAAFVVIHLSDRFLEAFDAETNLLAHFPCSIGARFDKRPVGELKVIAIAPNPNYTFDPAVFPESPEAQAIGHKLILPPGPNNPVGVAWIGLDRPGYGMHGTPAPEQVGRTESHGCFRLANWDAEYLVKLVWIGMPVEVVP